MKKPSPEITKKAEDLFHWGRLGDAFDLVKTYPLDSHPVVDMIKTRMGEIVAWNRDGRPSCFVDPEYWEQFPKFPLALQYIKTFYPDQKVKLLDIGCFTGYFSRMMILKGHDAYGCDIQKDLMEKLNEKFKGKFKYIRAELVDTAYKHEDFDVITMFDALEHFLNDSWAVKSALKLLKKDGLLLVNVPDGMKYPDDSNEHMRAYTEESLIKLIPNIKVENCLDEKGLPTLFGVKVNT